MDNIDDILAEVSGGDTIPQEARDLRELCRAWVAERVAPEILPYPGQLMERVMERIRAQIVKVEQQTGDMDPRTSFGVIVLQTELERFKFLVRSFLRARIVKVGPQSVSTVSARRLRTYQIDKYALHILSTPSLSGRLAPEERRYAVSHQQLLHAHYLGSFLRDFPEQLRRLDDAAGGISMVETPDLESAVFCRVLRDVAAPGLGLRDEEGELPRWSRGDVHVLRYAMIRDMVLDGDVELI
ncbi:MAG: GINS complex subunit [Thelocarpon impressellum]|nr:MAG: GINS complex subunit [Thelocarpon impressellum]